MAGDCPHGVKNNDIYSCSKCNEVRAKFPQSSKVIYALIAFDGNLVFYNAKGYYDHLVDSKDSLEFLTSEGFIPVSDTLFWKRV